jgi:hypothetical protein
MTDNKPMTAPADEIELAKDHREAAEAVAYQDVSDEYPAKKRKRVLLMMDIRIVPILMLLYCQ